jgi:hypothetical protein
LESHCFARGLTPDQFWLSECTPVVFVRWAGEAAKRDISLAWHHAILARLERFPSLDELTADPSKQTDALVDFYKKQEAAEQISRRVTARKAERDAERARRGEAPLVGRRVAAER